MTPILELPLATPAFVYDESRILAAARLLKRARGFGGLGVLYSVKSFPFLPVLRLLRPWVDGFSVSSLFEARLAAEVGGPLHITTPGLRGEELGEIAELCGYIAFNSLEQFRRLQPALQNPSVAGVRVNPGLSFLHDRRHDPCREFSKLGIPVDELTAAVTRDVLLCVRIRGLHFHNIFSSRSFDPLKKTVALLENKLKGLLPQLEWVNLGGGYLFETEADLAALIAIARRLRKIYGIKVFFEPGKALVGDAGYLVATVIDLFHRQGKTVAVLDATVNHHPEIFEYQIRPAPAWEEPEQGRPVILAGCTCLAGDLFGEYRFARALRLGDKVAFAKVGAYSLVKANRFNGYNLPSIYAWDGAGEARLMKRYGYEEFQGQWTADAPV
jgi:carboxynorspermidine decarboxylase